MRKNIHTTLIIMMALGLTNCASMVNDGKQADKTGTRVAIGGKEFTRSAEECPNGLIMAYVADEPGSVKYRVRGVLSNETIDGKLNMYNVAGLRHHGYEKDKDVDYSKAPIGRVFNAIAGKFSDEVVTGAPTTKALTADGEASDKNVAINEPVTVEYYSKHKRYEANGAITKKAKAETEEETIKIDDLHSFQLSFNNDEKNYQKFAIPTPIRGTGVTTDYNKPLTGEVGGNLTLEIQPSSDDSVLLIQISNHEAKGKGITYELQIDNIQDKTSVVFPLKDVKAGEYDKVNIFRVARYTTEADGLSICVDVASGITSSIVIKEPKKEEAK